MKPFNKCPCGSDYDFDDTPNTSVITCCHVLSSEEPVLYVTHDADDGMWQFLCSRSHTADAARVVGLQEIFDLDNSIGFLSQMKCGYYATRKSKSDCWKIKRKL